MLDDLYKDPLKYFLLIIRKEELYKEFKHFSTDCDSKYNARVTNGLQSSIKFKHAFAKFLVDQALTKKYFFIPKNLIDLRLKSLIYYYIWTYILNNDIELTSDQRLNLSEYYEGIHTGKGSYLEGNIIYGQNPLLPVRMRNQDDLYPYYRIFIVNTLCFTSEKFILGIRCDWGPVHAQQYHKGCTPIEGYRTDAQGRVWTLFKVDASTSDDFTAVFSNGLDGDGTVEICDYICDTDVRVIFRMDY